MDLQGQRERERESVKSGGMAVGPILFLEAEKIRKHCGNEPDLDFFFVSFPSSPPAGRNGPAAVRRTNVWTLLLVVQHVLS